MRVEISKSGECGVGGGGGVKAYLVCLIIHAICSVEQPTAGTMRSPSFSRASSSITTTNSPRAMAATALSTVSNANAVRTDGVRSFGARRGGEERLTASESATGRVGARGAYEGGMANVLCERTATGAMVQKVWSVSGSGRSGDMYIRPITRD